MNRIALVLTVGSALAITLAAPANTLYVNLNNLAPAKPYAGWSSAATNIQDAVDQAVERDEIVVTNGVYQTGWRVLISSNRVAVIKAVTVRSVNGPEVTIIRGSLGVRCAYLTNGAALIGFTLTNGLTDGDGGGVLCASLTAVVSNCALVSNSATSGDGGGAYSGTLYNCTLTGNRAGYAGGGAAVGILNNCTLTGNQAGYSGGGTLGGKLNNCLLAGNSAGTQYGYGGGAYGSLLNNCTLTGNWAGFAGGGASGGTLNNCIVYYNQTYGGNMKNYDGAPLNYCCTWPMPQGIGNITNEPAFVNAAAGDFHLSYGSPCIDAGTNRSGIITNDLEGSPRPLDGNGDGMAAFDIGAYEFNRLAIVLTGPAWDRSGRYQFTFSTVAGVNYTIQASTDLKTWSSALAFKGWDGPVTVLDPNAAGSHRGFYRVRVGP